MPKRALNQDLTANLLNFDSLEHVKTETESKECDFEPKDGAIIRLEIDADEAYRKILSRNYKLTYNNGKTQIWW